MTAVERPGPWLRSFLFLTMAALPVGVVLAPIGAFLLHSLYRMVDGRPGSEPSLDNYAAFFGNPTYWQTYLGTLQLCALVTLTALVIGYPVALFVWRRRGTSRYLLLLAIVLPLFMSYIVKLYTLRAVLGVNGLLNQALLASGVITVPSTALLFNQRAVLLTMTVIYLPFVVLPIFLSLERIPRSLIAASADLGAGFGSTFRRVVLPLSLPGAVAGALFTFVLALGDFVTPQMVGGTTGFTFGRVIWSQFGLAFNWPFGAAMAAVLLATAVALIMLAGLAASRQRV